MSTMLCLDLGALVPGSGPPSRALTYVIAVSNFLVPVLGTVMLRNLQAKVLQVFGAPIQDGSRDLADTRQELVNVLKARRWQSQGLGRALGLEDEDPLVKPRIFMTHTDHRVMATNITRRRSPRR